jgi:hypothetical protein
MPGIHQRLVQLERLVMAIAGKPNATPNVDSNDINHPVETPNADTVIDGRSDRGIIRASGSQSHYVGGDHWAAILDSIAELKDHFHRQQQTRMPISPNQERSGAEPAANIGGRTSRRSLLLYGGYPQHSQAEILAALPPKDTVDRYISRYFNRQELVSCESFRVMNL